jgi:hypothetical protein
MRRLATLCFAMAALLLAAVSAPEPAAAGWDRHDPYYDPYFYYPSPRGYYPYYNSGQWRSAREMRWKRQMSRRHYAYPQYNPAWGHPVYMYRNRAWHRRHHGGHHIGHW